MTEYHVQVKVLHTWRQYTKLSGESLEIILSDAQVYTFVYGTSVYFCNLTNLIQLSKVLTNNFWKISYLTSYLTGWNYEIEIFSRSVRPDDLQVSLLAVDDLPGSRLVNAEVSFAIDF